MKKDSNNSFALVISRRNKFHLRFNTLLINGGSFSVIHVHSIQQAVQVSKNNNILVIFIDSSLLDHEKINDCLYLRKIFSKYIAVISSKDYEVFDEAEILNYGADAYFDGNRSDKVLFANIQALMRRKINNAYGEIDDSILVQDLELNLKSFQLHHRKKLVNLTHGEFLLLSILVMKAGEVVSRENLLMTLFGTSDLGDSRSIDLRISLLRKKLGDTQRPYRYIKTIRGCGYILLTDHVDDGNMK